ncbi:hypothetical protein EBZ37_00990 [bacterium]|nr:hypothetical protein [bacterium]
MRTAVVLISAALGLGACGSDSTSSPCASSPFIGAWAGSRSGNADTLVFSASCAGTSSYCGAAFTYPNLPTPFGAIPLEVTSTNSNTGCLPAGSTTCAYLISSSTLTITCGEGDTLTYTKQ